MSQTTPAFTLRYRINAQDHAAATKLALRMTPQQKGFFIILMALCAGIAAANLWDSRDYAIAALAGVAAVFFMRLVVQPMQAQRQFRKHGHDGELTAEGLDEGLRIHGEGFDFTLNWQEAVRWRHNEDFLILYPMAKAYYIFPLDSLDSDQKAWLFNKLETTVGPAI